METISYDIHDTQAFKRAIMEESREWHPQLLGLARHAEDPVSRSLYILAIGWSWKNRLEIILIGDAAHVMNTFCR